MRATLVTGWSGRHPHRLQSVPWGGAALSPGSWTSGTAATACVPRVPAPAAGGGRPLPSSVMAPAVVACPPVRNGSGVGAANDSADATPPATPRAGAAAPPGGAPGASRYNLRTRSAGSISSAWSISSAAVSTFASAAPESPAAPRAPPLEGPTER
eukprot:scaffold29803_cov107-Isochrysis_galbana.AAC.3